MPSSLTLHRTDDVDAFRAHVDPFLRAREAEHALLLGILTGLQAGRRFAGPPLLLAVEDAAGVRAVALRTPPFKLVLSLADDEAVRALADGLAEVELPGVNGARGPAEAFAGSYAPVRGLRAREVMALGLYRLDEVIAPPTPAGAFRWLEPRDREPVRTFLDSFHREAHAAAAVAPDAAIDEALRGEVRGMAVWETGGTVVSLAGWTRAHPGSDRIGLVYTPPEQRGRGYASALVAELSQRRLDAGARFCTLYTDLANPTSNAIYGRIGYRRLLDAVELAFEPGG